MASDIATNLFAFILVLGFLVFAHEAGHFLMAKLFRVRVFVFSFGFGKRLFGFRRGDTDYRVSAIPLGGYVRMAGETAEDERDGDPNEFLSKPKWQRFLILFAGPGANVIIAIGFLAWLNMAGVPVLRDSAPVLGTVLPNKAAAAAGLEPGDVLLAINGEKLEDSDDARMLISMNPRKPLKVSYKRGDEVRETILTPDREVGEYGVAGRAGVTFYQSTEIGKVRPGTAAATAGLREGDFIVGVEGRPVESWDGVADVLQKKKGAAAKLDVRRGNRVVSLTLPAQKRKNEDYPGFSLPTVERKLPLAAAVKESIDQNLKMVRYTFATLGRLFQLQGSVKDFSGPLDIARISGDMMRTGWEALVFLMASISLQLAIMNLLPIPVLDGGHIFILLIEGAAGREISVRMKERITQVGFAVLATLMLVVLCNDVIKNVKRLVDNS